MRAGGRFLRVRRAAFVAALLTLLAAPAAAADTFITAKPSAYTNQTSATFRFHSDSPLVRGYRCALDGVEVGCASPQTYASLEAGSHSFTVRPETSFDPATAVHTWEIDLRPPSTSITRRPPFLTRARVARLSFEASEDESSFECRLDGEAYRACSPSPTYANLRDGAHTLMVRARDRAGNVDASPVGISWVVDNSAPLVRAEVVAAARGSDGKRKDVARLRPTNGSPVVLPKTGVLMRGEITDLSPLDKVEISLRRLGDSGCSYFDGRRAVKRGDCDVPRFLPARLAGTRWSYRLPRGSRLPTGNYTLAVRAYDGAGNVSKGFTLSRLPAPTATLRLLTFNVTGGPAPGPAFRVGNLAKVVGVHNADVIALQEICHWAADDLAEMLGQFGYKYSAHLPAVTGIVDDRPGSPGDCEYGNAIISRLPLAKPSTRASSWLLAPPGCRSTSGQDLFTECRLATGVDVVPVGLAHPVRLNSVQIGPTRDPHQAAEINRLARLATAGHPRSIVLGDFNLAPDEDRMLGLKTAGFRLAGTGSTFPFTSADTPFLQLDGVWVRAANWRLKSLRLVDPQVCETDGACFAISDHRAVVSTIDLR